MLKRIVLTVGATLALAAAAIADTPATATGNLNIRSGPGPQFSVRLVINANTPVSVISCQPGTGWCRVSYRGVVGWASSDYLRAQSGATFAPARSGVVALGLISGSSPRAQQGRTLWSADPSRPRDCARYVVDSEDPCY